MNNLVIMEIIALNEFKFRKEGEKNWIPASVPGNVHMDLYNNSLIEDPFFRMNEKELQWIEYENWNYISEFKLSKKFLTYENIEMCFDGLDTFAEIYVNGNLIFESNNMFRIWKNNIEKLVIPGKNILLIKFLSPINQVKDLVRNYKVKLPVGGDQPTAKESVFIRKAPCQFGWDWGPRFVTMGIWRPAYIQSWNNARILDLEIRQNKLTRNRASLNAVFETEVQKEGIYSFQIFVEDHAIANYRKELSPGKHLVKVPFEIKNPRLWWCNGLGEPFLYEITGLIRKGDIEIDRKSYKTGLRSIELITDPDEQGETFYFKLNGHPTFLKGANYIPADNFLNRVTPERHRKFVLDAKNSNMNCLRVWGGGIYQDDEFYDLCNENGILIWQDFMFACSMYPFHDDFLENVRHEVADNVKRLRRHPCIAIWCGNVEINEAWHTWGWQEKYSEEEKHEIWEGYLKLFHEVIPESLALYDKTRVYWPSSPLYGYQNDKSYKYGDVHYWGVWHNKKPISDYNTHVGRFVSEYGMQSYPLFESIKKFTLPEDRNYNSEVMNWHQRDPKGNELVKDYINKYYPEPKDFPSFVYITQLMQAESVKLAIEAHRRSMPYCMGSLYWQLNDTWPVASWASIDYYGRWKALQYFVRKAFNNTLVSPVWDNGKIEIHVVNDSVSGFIGNLLVKIIDFQGKAFFRDNISITVRANSSEEIYSIPEKYIKKEKKNDLLLSVKVMKGDSVLCDNILYFDYWKSLNFPDPEIKYDIEKMDRYFVIKLNSSLLSKNVFLDLPGHEGFFSDNFFDIIPGEDLTVKYFPENDFSTAEFVKNLKIISITDAIK